MTPEHQPAGRQRKILIVEDDIDLAEMLNAYFNIQGYVVLSTTKGGEAVALASEELPDLVILDIHLPDIDGFEVARCLSESHKTRRVPILFLTERSERDDKLHGLEMGVVDYITKPFDIQELRLRVRNVLRRTTTTVFENPVTGLPEGGAIDEELKRLLKDRSSCWGILVATLFGLDAFRELYGFVASDDVLRVISLMIGNAAREIGGDSTFYGHLYPQAFIMIVPAEKLDPLEARIQERAAQSLEYFYPSDNRGPNAYTRDRLRVAINRLTAEQGPFKDIGGLKAALEVQ